MKAYPSRDGVPVPTEEVGLALSRLNPDLEKNWNNHHLYWAKSQYNGTLYKSLRDLDRSQEIMLKDQHNMGKTALHTLYGPPEMPTPEQAMNQLEEAYELGEKFKIWRPSMGMYALIDFTPEYWDRLKKRYNDSW